MQLIKYRDWGISTHTYFWVNRNDQVLSPYFDSQEQAETWLNEQKAHVNNTNGTQEQNN
jgi:hypothetical protein